MGEILAAGMANFRFCCSDNDILFMMCDTNINHGEVRHEGGS